MNKYVNSGGLWMRQKRNPKAPDMTGDITIGGDVLEHIKNELRAGATEVKLHAATWRAMQTPSGPNYNLKVSIPMNQQGGGSGGQRQQGGYGQQRGGYGNQRQDGYQQGGGYAPQDNRGGYGNQRQQQRDMYDQQEQNSRNQQDDYQRNNLDDEIPF